MCLLLIVLDIMVSMILLNQQKGIYLDFTILSSCSIMSNELKFDGMPSSTKGQIKEI